MRKFIGPVVIALSFATVWTSIARADDSVSCRTEMVLGGSRTTCTPSHGPAKPKTLVCWTEPSNTQDGGSVQVCKWESAAHAVASR